MVAALRPPRKSQHALKPSPSGDFVCEIKYVSVARRGQRGGAFVGAAAAAAVAAAHIESSMVS